MRKGSDQVVRTDCCKCSGQLISADSVYLQVETSPTPAVWDGNWYGLGICSTADQSEVFSINCLQCLNFLHLHAHSMTQHESQYPQRETISTHIQKSNLNTSVLHTPAWSAILLPYQKNERPGQGALEAGGVRAVTQRVTCARAWICVWKAAPEITGSPLTSRYYGS